MKQGETSKRRCNGGNFVAAVVMLILLSFGIDTGMRSYAQSQKKKEIQEDTTFERPEPSRPIQPEIPDVNRYQEDKIFLEYADSLYKQSTKRDTIEKQILKGDVVFRQAGMWMYCDSAYYYPQENSLDAFSNVKMEQGDTLFVYADKLFYDGDTHFAKLKNGPSREKVILINNDVTLTTDSLDYDMNLDLGWYTRWGTIDDKVNTLTSLYGEYSPTTKRAEFFTDVVLVNNKDGFTMLTDTLYYSTETHIADIESPTVIQGANDTILTRLATYYTDTGDADLLSRSTIIHRDSTGNITTLEGDSIIYDNATRISRAYMFRDPFKVSTPMVITDTAQKTTLIGGFGLYNDSTKEALATIYPLLMEYSQGDTLFLRADTIKTYIVTEMVAVRNWKTKSGYPEFKGLPIVMADSVTGGIWIDSVFFEARIPYIDTPLSMLLKEVPPFATNTGRNIRQNIEESVETLPEPQKPEIQPLSEKDSVKNPFNQNDAPMQRETMDSIVSLASRLHETFALDSLATLEDIAELYSLQVRQNLNYIDSISIKKPSETDSLGNIMEVNPDTVPGIDISDYINTLENAGSLLESAVPEKITVDEEGYLLPDSIPIERHVALAYHRARFFKKDMQGVADSMVFIEKDSMLYMFRKPIVWSGERQVTGNRIDVHFNDSTADRAYLPEFGLISEHVEEDFYNQIFGKEITAYFENQGLRRMEVSGNVETIFLPQEEDSTYNRLVNAESSYLDAYLTDNELDKLKMWPEVSGTVTPIFLVKKSQMYLQKFKWWNFLRPVREWYGDQLRWADNLGEVPDELEQYFLAPSDFGEPKSFPGARYIPPEIPKPVIMLGDTLATDSLNFIPPIEVPDSIGEEIDSPAIEKAEETETLSDIEESEETMQQFDNEMESEAKEIEETEITEDE